MELDDLIQSIDIVDFLSQYTELKERNGEFWGLSPLKDENTPSFSVRRETNSFFDFSSGVGGNCFTFLKFYYKCSGREAVEKLKEYIGFDGQLKSPNQKLPATLVCKRFQKQAKHEKPIKTSEYRDDCMDKYEKNWDKLKEWKNEGISRDSLNKFQVYYDSFSNRLVYPIRNIEGKIVNIGGRTLDPQWKVKGLRKYTYFSGWGTMNVIYGLYENYKAIMEKQEIIIFEGCKSVLLADTWEIHNCAALLTSHLSPAQMLILARLGVRVVFALDKEVKIKNDYNIAKLKRYTNVEFIWDRENLLNDKDSPVDKGQGVFKKLYSQRVQYK